MKTFPILKSASKASLSLRRWLVLMLMIVVAVPLLIFWAWPYSRAMQNELELVRDRHLLIARNLSAALQRYHRDITATFDFATQELLKGTAKPIDPRLLENLNLRHVSLVDGSTGRVLFCHAGSGSCPASLPQAQLAELRAASTEGSTVITGVRAGSDAEPVLQVIRRQGNRLVIGTMDTRYFVELGKSIAFGVKGHAVIVDQAGKVLSHPLRAWEHEMRDLSKISAVKRILAGEQGVDTFFSPAFKDDMVTGFTAVNGTGWGVMVPQPLSELRESAKGIQNAALSVFSLGLLIAILAAWPIALLLARPVEQTIAAARRLAASDKPISVGTTPAYMPTEFRDLFATFNEMAERIAKARGAECKARHAAEQANASKTDFLRTVTHELRSPLNAIIGFADMLKSDPGHGSKRERNRRLAEDISAGSRHLLSLTNDLLDLARIEAGKYDLSEAAIGLDEIASRAVRYVEREADKRGMTVSFAEASDAPAVYADERALFQAVLNLTSNAVRYGRPGGKVTVSAKRLPNGTAELLVADDGPGIAEADLERVLLPFQRISTPQNRDVQGSGLGLPIVKRLAELHGGTFELQSTLGAGTRAIIRLPSSRVLADPRTALQTAA